MTGCRICPECGQCAGSTKTCPRCQEVAGDD